MRFAYGEKKRGRDNTYLEYGLFETLVRELEYKNKRVNSVFLL